MARPRRRKVTRDEWGSITRTEDGTWRLRYRGPDGKRRDGGCHPTRAAADDAPGPWRSTGGCSTGSSCPTSAASSWAGCRWGG